MSAGLDTNARFRTLLETQRADCVHQREDALAECAQSVPDPVAHAPESRWHGDCSNPALMTPAAPSSPTGGACSPTPSSASSPTDRGTLCRHDDRVTRSGPR